MKKHLCLLSLIGAILFFACTPNTVCDCPKTSVTEQTKAQTAQGCTAEALGTDLGKPVVAEGQEIVLRPASKVRDVSLMESLWNRKSSREVLADPIKEQDLSDLLWASYGINRVDEKKLTAPSSRNRQSVSVYAAFEKGIYKYESASHRLVLIQSGDLRPNKSAPVELIFSSNAEDPQTQGIDTGVAAENVYLFCASAGLGTVLRMMREDSTELRQALKLKDEEKLVFNLAIGYLK